MVYSTAHPRLSLNMASKLIISLELYVSMEMKTVIYTQGMNFGPQMERMTIPILRHSFTDGAEDKQLL